MTFLAALLPIFVFISFIWLSALSFLVFRAITNYNRLTQGVTHQTLSEILSHFLNQNQVTQEEQKKIMMEMRKLRQEQLRFVERISLVRFNPFSDTGGDQSFVIALLNGEQSGIVITSLYARTGSRWYVKTIKKGKAVEYDLSKEEQEAVRKALVKPEAAHNN